MPGLSSKKLLETSIERVFAEVVQRQPQSPALDGPEGSLTYAELEQRVERLAVALARETPPGRGCVLLVCDLSNEMVVASLAIMRAGKILVAVHPGQSLEALQAVVQEVEPQAVLCSSQHWERAVHSGANPCFLLHDLDSTERASLPFNQPDDPGVIYFTSGSGGRSQGVVKSHRSLLHRVWLGGQLDAIQSGERASLLTHSAFASSEADILATLLQGACCCPFDLQRSTTRQFQNWLESKQINLLHPPVVYFRKFLQHLAPDITFPSVRLVALAGETVVPQDLELWKRHFGPHCRLHHRFSSSETALLTLAVVGPEQVPCSRVPFGTVVEDKHIEIHNPSGQPLGPGEVGEIYVRSRYLALGYWKPKAQAIDRFRDEPGQPGVRGFRSGDLGRWLENGELEFLGRQDDLVKIRGYRVSLSEVETALRQLPTVMEAAVREVEGELHAWLTGGEDTLTSAQLRDALREHLADWKIPGYFHGSAQLPTTPNGKLDRKQLKPEAALDPQLLRIWTAELGRPGVGPEQNLLEAGADSITVVLLLNKIEQTWGARITPAQFFAEPTLAALQRQLNPVAQTPGAPPTAAPTEETVSDRFLASLTDFGVEFIFLNPGTDSIPLLESWVKFEALGRPCPRIVLCLHESVALAAAHGHFMLSQRPQVVFVHVDLGTQNLGGNLHNAQRGRAGVLICAGRAPFAVDNRIPGGRDRYAHWVQEQLNQAATVEGYVRWHYQLPHQHNLEQTLERAFQLTQGPPAGPVYLVLPREILLERWTASTSPLRPRRRAPIQADRESLEQLAQWLLQSSSPVLLVSQLGRQPAAVDLLTELAELTGLAVVESRHRHNFPLDHFCHQGFQPLQQLREADLVLVLEHEVPWIPEQWSPSAHCRVAQIDQDVDKSTIPIWGFPVDLALQGDPQVILRELLPILRSQLDELTEVRLEKRRRKLQESHRQRRQSQLNRALDARHRSPMEPEWVAWTLNQHLEENHLVVCEASSNAPAFWAHLDRLQAGSFFQSLGSCLGWGLGAALGCCLAKPERKVSCIIGDGCWMFANPLATYEAARQQGVAFFTLVLNNSKYAAINEAVQSLYPGGWSRSLSRYPASALPEPGYYQRVAAGAGLWSRLCAQPQQLAEDLREALAEVDQGRCSLLEVVVGSTHA